MQYLGCLSDLLLACFVTPLRPKGAYDFVGFFSCHNLILFVASVHERKARAAVSDMSGCRHSNLITWNWWGAASPGAPSVNDQCPLSRRVEPWHPQDDGELTRRPESWQTSITSGSCLLMGA